MAEQEDYLTIPFGKHKGKLIKDLETNHIVFLIEKKYGSKELLHNLRAEIIDRLDIKSTYFKMLTRYKIELLYNTHLVGKPEHEKRVLHDFYIFLKRELES